MPTSRFFGKLAPSKDYAQISHRLAAGEPKVSLDLNLERPAELDQKAVDALDATVERLPQRRKKALAAIKAELKNPRAQPLQFWAFHRDELEGFAALGHTELIGALRLARVGFYPQANEHYATFDFVIDRAKSDQLLVVHFSRAGAPLEITWES